MSAWFRRDLLRKKEPNSNSAQIRSTQQQEDQLLGVTQQLIDLVKSFTLETFKNFPFQDEEGTGDSSATRLGNAHKDLSQWQERHAVLVLRKVNELSQLRFKLCPRYMKEHQFWRIYFSLVKRYVSEYEMHAAQLTTLKERERKEAKLSKASAYEIEMSETRQSSNVQE